MSATLATLTRGRPRIQAVHAATAGAVCYSVLNQGLLVVSGILSARLLGATQRGDLALLILLPTVLAQLGGLGLPLAATYWIASGPRRTTAIIQRLQRPWLLQTLLLIVVDVVALMVWLRVAGASMQLAGAFTLPLAPAMLAYQYGLAVLQGERRFGHYYGVSLLPAGVYSVSIAALWLAGRATLPSITLVWVVAWSLAGLVAVVTARIGWFGRRRVTDEASPALSTLLRFGLKGFLGSASPIETFRLDQAIIGVFLSPAALGLYVVATGFTNLVRFLAQSIGSLTYAQVSAQPDPATARGTMWRFFWLTLGACLAIVALLEVVTGKLVPFVYGAEFADAVPLTRIVLLGAVLLGSRRVLSDGARGLHRPEAGTIAEAVALLVLPVALAVCIHRWGIDGAAWALLGTSALALMLLCLLVTASRDGAPPSDLHRHEVAHTDPPPRPRRALAVGRMLVVLLGAIGLALGAGAGVVMLPWYAGAAAAGLGFVAVSLLASRAWLLQARAPRPAVVPRTLPAQRVEASSATTTLRRVFVRQPDLRLARWLFYGGMLTIAQLTLRVPKSGLDISDWLFFASIGVVGLESLYAKRLVGITLPLGLVIGMMLFATGGLASTFRSLLPISSAAVVARLLFLTLIWFWLATVVLQRPEHVRTALLLWITSAAITGASAIAQLFLGTAVPGTTSDWGRMTGFTPQPNELGALSAVALIPTLSLVLNGRGGVRLWAAGCALLICAGELLSGSLSALGAVAIAGVFWLVWANLRMRLLVPLGAVALAVAAVFLVISSDQSVRSPFSRVTEVTASNQQDATLWSRVRVYRAGWGSVQRDPFVGVGLDLPSQLAIPAEFQIHNILLGPWVTAGILGLAGIVFVIGEVIISGRGVVRRSRSDAEAALAVSLFAAMLTFLLYALTSPALYTRYGSIPVALLLALRAQQLPTLLSARRPASMGLPAGAQSIDAVPTGAAVPA